MGEIMGALVGVSELVKRFTTIGKLLLLNVNSFDKIKVAVEYTNHMTPMIYSLQVLNKYYYIHTFILALWI